MPIHMRDVGPPLSQNDLTGFETRHGLKLPASYAAFLLKFNGGRPTPNAFALSGLENNPFGVVMEFFSISGSPCKAAFLLDTLADRLPDRLFPIGRDDGGDLICLSFRDQDADSVVFWDYYSAVSKDEHQHVYFVAPNFGAFVDMLQELPD